MPLMPVDQKIPNVKRKVVSASKQKTPRAKFDNPQFKTSDGDLGIQRVQNPGIARMVKAPTRTGDSIAHHVGKVGAVMKQSGMMG